jgi:hypothetical protein
MTNKLIEHDANGPFVRSHNANTDGQTETVYAIRVSNTSGKEEFWDPRAEPHTQQRFEAVRDMAYRFMNRDAKRRQLVFVEAVSRTVTVSATDWEVRGEQE